MATIQDTPTPDSIARAKAARDADRRQLEAAAGVRIAENGRIVRGPYIILCPRPGCTFAASALNEGRATRAIVGHLVQVHVPRVSCT